MDFIAWWCFWVFWVFWVILGNFVVFCCSLGICYICWLFGFPDLTCFSIYCWNFGLRSLILEYFGCILLALCAWMTFAGFPNFRLFVFVVCAGL